MSTPTSPSTGVNINSVVTSSLPSALADKIPQVPESKAELTDDAKVAAARTFAGLRSLLAGGFGGICAVVVGHPFDLVKVRMQTAEKGVYSSAFDVVRKSIAKDGIRRGLYAGVSAPLVGVTPMCKYTLHLHAKRNSPSKKSTKQDLSH
jgi:solute carrier family 25 carnitine/acylcarnitine transporter 20/29